MARSQNFGSKQEITMKTLIPSAMRCSLMFTAAAALVFALALAWASAAGLLGHPDTIPSPVSYWPADGNAKDIVGGHNGTLVGNATYTTGCSGLQTDQAFSLDGDASYVDITGSENLYAYQDVITVAAWILLTGTQTNGTQADYAGIVTKGDSTWRLALWSPLRPPNFVPDVLYFGVGVSPSFQDAVGKTPVYDGKWHLAVGVYDGTYAKLYVDGQLDGQVFRGQPLPTNGYPVQIGSNAEAGGRYFNGAIDEIQIWHAALTQAQIQEIYNAGNCKLTTPTPTATATATATATPTASARPSPTARPRPTPAPRP
jgi:Concanavalin A-like lectin/glucanases superfamily